jgi:hypothetical protein
MMNQSGKSDPGGIARGQDAAPPPETSGGGTNGESRGTETEPAVDEMGIPVPSGAKPNPRGGTLGTAVEDITEPGEDANLPQPAKPISQESRPSQG